MAKQVFTASQVLTAAQQNSLQSNDYNQTVSTKTASYTLVAADAGTRVVMNAAGATTITVNTSLFSAGDTLVLQNIGAGTCTVTAGTATVSSAGPLAIPQYGSGTLYFTSTGVSIYFPSAVTSTSKVLQVVSTTKTDAFSTTSASYVDVTGMSVSITPTSASSTILVMTGLAISSSGSGRMSAQLLRDATNIAISTGFASTNQTSCVFDNNYQSQYVSIAHMDSPATTSSTTYKFQIKSGGGTCSVNEQQGSTAHGNVSTLTVMEIAA